MSRCRRAAQFASILLAGAAYAAGETVPTFLDIAASAGLKVITYSGGIDKNHILESTGNGVLALDYDQDGDQDLYFVNAFRLLELGRKPEYTSTLYRNDGNGIFVDVTATAGVGAAVYGHGGCVGDIDGDGLPDIYLTAFGRNILYHNKGNGSFEDIGDGAGVAEPGWGIGATFLDADGDNDQDLYVANYIDATWDEILAARRTRSWRGRVDVMDGPRGLREARNVFFLNRGDGTFEEATESSGLAEGGMGYSMGVTSFDYDRDGRVDIYVGNDSTPNRLYRNLGDGRFEETGLWTGSSYNADGRMQGSMGTGFGDYDGDGWPDLIVTNFAHDYYALYRNLAGESFQDESISRQLVAPTFRPLGWAAVFMDVDNDRDLDLFFSNGHIYPQVDLDASLHESYRQRNQLLLNEAGKFRDVSSNAGQGFEVEESSRGASVFDLDNDGDLDIAVSNQDAPPTLLQNQLTNHNHWIVVDLRGDASNPQALGTTIEVRAGQVLQMRQLSSGGSYASQNDMRLHLGLGDLDTVAEVTVIWADGGRQRLKNLPASRFIRVYQ